MNSAEFDTFNRICFFLQIYVQGTVLTPAAMTSTPVTALAVQPTLELFVTSAVVTAKLNGQ